MKTVSIIKSADVEIHRVETSRGETTPEAMGTPSLVHLRISRVAGFSGFTIIIDHHTPEV